MRSRLILKAIEKAEQQFNFHYTGQNVIYVADTVHDVTAAHDAGLPIIIYVVSGAIEMKIFPKWNQN